MEKTHYRKVFKSDHLGSADLEEMIEEGKRLVFTIKNVKSYVLEAGNKNSGVVVAGKRISANIAYFVEPIKPLVLNATNSKTMKKLTSSSFIEDWIGCLIELYIDYDVKMKGEKTEGVRIKPKTPVIAKPILNADSKRWEMAKQRVKDGATIEDFRKHFTISQDDYDSLCG